MMPIRRSGSQESTPCNRFGVALAQVTTTAAVARQMRTSPPSKSSGAWKDAKHERPRARADEQLEGAGVRAVIDPSRVDSGFVQGDHDERGYQGQPGEGARKLGAAADAFQEEDDQEGKEHIELLLHGQRPGMPQRRRGGNRGEVALVAKEHPPVRGVEGRRKGVKGNRCAPVLRGERGRRDDNGEEHHGERREEAPGSGQPKVREDDVAAASLLGQEQRGDQEARDDEEDVNAKPSAGQPEGHPVRNDHGDDGDRAQSVKRRPIEESVVAFRGAGVGVEVNWRGDDGVAPGAPTGEGTNDARHGQRALSIVGLVRSGAYPSQSDYWG